MSYLLLCLMLLVPSFAGALEFDEETQRLPLGPHLHVFEDVRGDASIEDITSPAMRDSFHRHRELVLNRGYSPSVFWVRLDLTYLPKQPGVNHPWLLELAYPPLDDLRLYTADAQGRFQLRQHTGDTLPFASRQIRQHSYLFELDLPAGQPQQVYLRLQSQGSVQAPLTLWHPTRYLEEQPARVYVLGMIYGVLLVMLIYNLFIYVGVRDTSYLFYILYIAAFGLYQLSVNGAAIEYLWPNSPWWANVATPFFIGAALVFGSQFTRRFLRTSEHSTWIDRSLLLLVGGGLLVLVLSLSASYAVSMLLATYLTLTFTVVVFASGIIAWMKGMRVARFFIIAWTAFLLGGMVNALMLLGYLPNMFLTMYASQIGSAVEVGLLSLALADRINIMKQERARILKDAGMKLEALNQELADSNRLKDEFLATVSHELRTPMNGVLGSLELMRTLPLDGELEHYHKTATGSARDMMRLINDLLGLTELQAGRLYPRRETFSLRGLLDGLLAGSMARASSKGLDLLLQVDESLPDTVEGDATKLHQALNCLLDNALKFTQRGTIRLRVSIAGKASDVLPLRFEVIDSGVGFAKVESNKLYQPFLQVDGSLTRQYGGLGIGLAMCRELVELLGGQLSHESVPGQGSCFRLELPLTLPVQARGPRTERSHHGLALRGPEQCTLLVVEGNAISQLVIRGMLLKMGYQVRLVDDGAAALELLSREHIDGVLINCQLDVLDGYATCRALRHLPGCAQLPVLGLAENGDHGERERCIEVGMNDCFHAPLKFEQLRSALHDWVLCALPESAETAVL